MTAQYPSVTHDPLYIGLRAPRPDDVYPLLRRSSSSRRRTASSSSATDGFWSARLWGQLTTTLSILTYRGDASSVYTYTQEPVAKPIEAALIILGIAWALWRWRDTRMAVLSIWFWSTVIVGGVLTIDAPYMARLVGIIPTLAIFAAIPLSKLIAEFVRMWSASPRPQHAPGARQVAGGGGPGGPPLLASLGQNYSDYFFRYLTNWPFTEVTGQAVFRAPGERR